MSTETDFFLGWFFGMVVAWQKNPFMKILFAAVGFAFFVYKAG